MDLSNALGATPLSRSGIRRKRYLDVGFLVATCLLMLIGLMSLYSIDRGGSSHFVAKQIVRIIVGLVPATIIFMVTPDFLRRSSNWLYLVSLCSLVAVLAIGHSAKGAGRWIDLGPFDVQPSEIAKILLAITLAAFYANRIDDVKSLRTYALSLLHIAAPLALVLKQPHLGGAMTMLVIWLGISLVAGAPIKYLVGTVVFALLALGAAHKMHVLPGYMSDRVDSFILGRTANPKTGKDSGENDSRYQQVRALIAFGSGGLFGQGYLKGENTGKGFVPEQQNDYISTVIGEEGGLMGVSLLLAAYGFFFYRVWLVMYMAVDPFCKLIVAGVFSYLAFHMIANLGMNLELLPVVGLWLPFLSAGGTAIWLCMSSTALVLNVRSREAETAY